MTIDAYGLNTQYICEKAMKRMWTLRRMKSLNLDENLILDTYIKEIRSILELAVPVWVLIYNLWICLHVWCLKYISSMDCADGSSLFELQYPKIIDWGPYDSVIKT